MFLTTLAFVDNFFDTIRVKCDSKKILELGLEKGYNFWNYGNSIGISFDETVEIKDVKSIIDIFDSSWMEPSEESIPLGLIRTDSFLNHPVFNSYHSETEMLRYIHRLEAKDLSLNFRLKIVFYFCNLDERLYDKEQKIY